MGECKYKAKDGECLYEKRFPYKEYCVEAPCPHDTPMTNADRVRSMSDEELAKELKGIGCPGICRTKYREDDIEQCYKCWLDWLRQEAADDKLP